MISKRAPSPATSSSGAAVSASAVNRLCVPLSGSSTAVKPAATMVAAATPLRAPMPPKSNAFSMCSWSRDQNATPDACCTV